MRVETHHHFNEPRVFEASQVVCWDPFGQPIAVILERAPGSYVVSHRGDSDWNKTLQSLGLQDTAVVDVLNAKRLHTD